MTTSDLAQAIRTFVSAIDKSTPLVGQLANLSEIWEAVSGGMREIAGNAEPGNAWAIVRRVHAVLQNAVPAIKTLKASAYVREANRLETAIDRLAEAGGIAGQRLHEYHQQVRRFRESYDNLVDSSYNLAEIFSFIHAAQSLYRLLSTDSETLNYIAEVIQPPNRLADGEDEVQFIFEGELDLGEISVKLDALNACYRELASAMGYAGALPRVVKIETGSLFITIAGWSAVLFVLSPLIREGAQAVWKRMLPEGRAKAAIKAKIEALKADAQIIDHLKKRGHKIDGLEELHGEKAERISSQIARFIEGHRIRVEGDQPTDDAMMLPAPDLKSLPAPDDVPERRQT